MPTSSKTPLITPVFGASIIGLAITLVGCAPANVQTTQTELRYMIAGIRVDPPAPGQNSVFVEFQDQTAQGGEFEDFVYQNIISSVEARGYINTKDHSKADYVLWATLRIFTEAGTEAGDRALVGLGAIAGGVGTAGVAKGMGASNNAAVIAGVVGGAGTAAIVSMMTKTNAYQMVIDLQLGKKVAGGVQTDTGNSAHSGLHQQTVAIGESGGSSMGQSKSQHMVENKVHFEMEQRIIALASGQRLAQDVARAALVPKLIDGLKSSLPRVR
jgi:hypothetical protein